MIARTFDAQALNALANDPSVRPFVGPASLGVLDLTDLIANPLNVALQAEGGAFVFHHDEPGRYQVHTMFLPEGRGAGVLPAFAQASRWMFVNTDCEQIVTQVPGSNRAADLMARRAGFTATFKRQAAWSDGSDITYYGLSLEDWRGRDETLEAAGEHLHTLMEAARIEADALWPDHPEDAAHNRAAGASFLMAQAGNPRKAVALYNRWARLAGYPQISLAVEHPVVIDMSVGEVKFVVSFGGRSDMEVLLCR